MAGLVGVTLAVLDLEAAGIVDWLRVAADGSSVYKKHHPKTEAPDCTPPGRVAVTTAVLDDREVPAPVQFMLLLPGAGPMRYPGVDSVNERAPVDLSRLDTATCSENKGAPVAAESVDAAGSRTSVTRQGRLPVRDIDHTGVDVFSRELELLTR